MMLSLVQSVYNLLEDKLIHLDGIDYQWATPSENAKAMVDFINNEALTNNIKNRKGEVIHIDINMASPIYIMLYGVGYLMSIMQRLMYSIGCNMSISSSSDRQMIDLAEIAGFQRKPASETTINATAFAKEDEDCVITGDLSYTVGGIVFHPSVVSVNIPMGKSGVFVLVSEEPCSENLPEVYSAEFDEPVPGLLYMNLDASVPGRLEETNDELRARLQDKQNSQTQVDRAIDAITNLPGVTLCNIWFNPSIDTNIIIQSDPVPAIGTEYIKNPEWDPENPDLPPDIEEYIKNPDYVPAEEGRVIVDVPPRKAALIIQGYNAKIPDMFYAHMSCLTMQGVPDRTIEMKYTTKSHQDIPFFFLTPKRRNVFVNLYVGVEYLPEMKTKIRQSIATYGAKLTIGQKINVGNLYSQLQKDMPTEIWKNIEMSIDKISWMYEVVSGPDELLTLSVENIYFIEEL